MIPEVGKIYKNVWNQYAQVLNYKFNGVDDRIELMMLGDGYQPYQRYEFIYLTEFIQYYWEIQ